MPGTDPLITITPSVDIGIIPWETYITSSTNPCIDGGIDNAGTLKLYQWKLHQHRQRLDLTDVR